MTRSPRRWPFQPGDDIQHYLSASAALTAGTISSLADTLGLDLWNIDTGPTLGHAARMVHVLADFADVDPALMHAGQIHMHYGSSLLPWSIASPIWTRDRVDLTTPRVCLMCISERPWALSSTWRIPIVSVCIEHGLPLVRSCPTCGHPLRVTLKNRPIDPVSERCGGCLRTHEANARLQQGADDDVLRAARQILTTMEAQEHGSDGSMDLAAVQDLAYLIAAEENATSKNPKSLYAKASTPLHLAVRAAARLANGETKRGGVDALDQCDPVSLRNISRGFRGALRPVAINAVLDEVSRRGRTIDTTPTADPQAWPALLPPDIFRLGMSDLLYDLGHASGEDIDWVSGRAVAATLAAAEHFSVSVPEATRLLGLPRHLSAFAQTLLRVARTEGRDEHLQIYTRRAADLVERCWVGRGSRAKNRLRDYRNVETQHPSVLANGTRDTEVLCRAPRHLAAA